MFCLLRVIDTSNSFSKSGIHGHTVQQLLPGHVAGDDDLLRTHTEVEPRHRLQQQHEQQLPGPVAGDGGVPRVLTAAKPCRRLHQQHMGQLKPPG